MRIRENYMEIRVNRNTHHIVSLFSLELSVDFWGIW